MAAGAPTLATQSGAFVAGTAAKPLAETALPEPEPIRTPPAKGNPPSPQTLRYDSEHPEKKPELSDSARMLAQSSKDSLAAESGSKEFTLEETQLTPTPASKGKGHGAKDLGKQNLAPTQARIPPGQPDATPTRVAPSTRPARNPATRLPRPPLTPSSIVTSQKAPSEASKEPKKEGYWKILICDFSSLRELLCVRNLNSRHAYRKPQSVPGLHGI